MYKSWRVRNQAICVLLIETFFVLMAIFLLDYALIAITGPIFLQSSQSMMRKEVKSQMDTRIWLYERTATRLIKRSAFRALNMNILYQFSQQVRYNYIQQPFECLTNFNNLDQYAYNTSYCYSFFLGKSTLTLEDYKILNYTALATQSLQMQDQDFNAVYVTSRPNALGSIQPGRKFVNFNPQARPWYMSQMLPSVAKNIINFCPPYRTYGTNVYVMTQTTNFTDINGTREGALGSEFNFGQMKVSNYDSDRIQTKIINQNGMIYLSGSISQLGGQIQNQTLTGFDESDFNQIVNVFRKDRYKSNCNNSDLSYLCRVNNIDYSEQYIMAASISRTGMILMIQVDPSKEFQQLRDQLNAQNNKLWTLFLNTTFIYLGIRIGSVFFCVILFYVILNPIDDIIAHTKLQINKSNNQKSVQRIILKEVLIDDPLYLFRISYDSLTSQLTHINHKKSSECHRMEELGVYPRRVIRHKQKLDIYIRYILPLIPDFDHIYEPSEAQF